MMSAALIREARLRAGLTQAELAGRTRTSQSAVARWEAGESTPTLERLRELLVACQLELRVSMEPVDPGESTLIESRLGLTPQQRLDDLTRAVRFLDAGRSALADALARRDKRKGRTRPRGRSVG
jgi:transcriptional regulator with XRE-family HTH domain